MRKGDIQLAAWLNGCLCVWPSGNHDFSLNPFGKISVQKREAYTILVPFHQIVYNKTVPTFYGLCQLSKYWETSITQMYLLTGSVCSSGFLSK